LEYKFRPLEYNGVKGGVGERLARSFIRNQLAPKLKQEEGWDHVLLSHNDYKHHVWAFNTKLFRFDEFRDDFVIHGFFPGVRFLSKYASAVGVLMQNRCTPDGLLFKLRDTGKTRTVKQKDCPSITKLRVDPAQKTGAGCELPVVDGELEVVEIKCGRSAKLMGKQRETYNDLIAKGIPLRRINVRIVSFDLNRFLVEERRFDRFQ